MKSNDETKCGEADRNRLQSIVSLLIGLFQNNEVIMLAATSMLVTDVGDETYWRHKVANIMILSPT